MQGSIITHLKGSCDYFMRQYLAQHITHNNYLIKATNWDYSWKSWKNPKFDFTQWFPTVVAPKEYHFEDL